MDPADGFQAAYSELESRMKALAESDGDVYGPNPEPLGPVDYVFICMEPSLGGRSADKARADVDAGFRNFINSIEDFLLHFAVRRYLCEPGQRYHVTDFSKGAMPVNRAHGERRRRYDRWYGLLEEELNLVAKPGAGVFAVGGTVAEQLSQRGFSWPSTRIMHYSGQAALARAQGIAGHEDAFLQFKSSVSLAAVLATAEDALEESGVPPTIRNETLIRLRKRQLSESRLQLIFVYKLSFERWRARRTVK